MTGTLVTATRQAVSLVDRIETQALEAIVEAGPRYGNLPASQPRQVLLEYVSADPNGPLTLSHARGGVLGDTLSWLLTTTGHQVTGEFYINDVTNSRQLLCFARALLGRYRVLLYESGAEVTAAPEIEATDYPEEYLSEIARQLIEKRGDAFLSLPEPRALIEIQRVATRLVRLQQQATLADLGVEFDSWFSESGLHQRGSVQKVLDRLRENGYAYERSGALWLKSTAFGDESDRTLVRPDGTPTYLAGDLTYHADKFERGFDCLVDIWNSDHATYIERTRAGLSALGYDASRLTILLYGPVRLLKDGTEVRGTRLSGPDGGATLMETLNDIPAPVARLLLLTTAAQKPVDLDTDLVSSTDARNPTVYLRRSLSSCYAPTSGRELQEEAAPLVESLTGFPQVVEEAASNLAPDRLLRYGLHVAQTWQQVRERGRATPLLARATAVVLDRVLEILGVPETPTSQE